MKKEVLFLQKKSSLYFDINSFYSIPKSNGEGYWVLSGGRRGHLGIWEMNYGDNSIQLQYGKAINTMSDIRMEVVIKFIQPPNEWSCWDPSKIKAGYIELIVLLLGRRDLHKGCSILSLQINPENGKTHIDSSRLFQSPGQNSKVNDICFWHDHIVTGMSQQLCFIGRYDKEKDAFIDFIYEYPCEIVAITTFSSNDNNGDNKYLVIGGMDKKIRWYIWNDDNPQELKKVHSVKAHSSRVFSLFVHNRTLYSGGGSSDPSIKSWKSPEDCEDIDGKKESGFLQKYEGHTDSVNGMIMLGDYLFSTSKKQDSTFRIWDLDQPKSIQARITDHKAIHGILKVNDNIIITGGNGGDKKLCIWSTNNLDSVSVNTTSKCILQ